MINRAGWIGAGIVLTVKLILVMVRPLAVSTDQATAWINSGIGPISLAIGGWMLQVLIVFLTTKLLGKKGWIALIVAINPWINFLTITEVFVSAGLTGWLVFLTTRKRWLKIAAVIVMIGSVFLNQIYLIKISQGNLLREISPAKLAEKTDETQKINFLATNKTYILPAVWRKLIYNKPTLAVQTVLKKSVELVDFEQWTNPTGAWDITSMSGLPPKGIWPLFYSWEIWPLVIGGWLCVREGVKFRWWWVLCILPAVIMEKKFFQISGILVWPGFMYLVINACEKIEAKRIFIPILILYVAGAGWLFSKMFWEESSWRYSDAYLYRQTALWLKQNEGSFEKAVVTNRFGPMDLMLKYYGVLSNNKIDVREIELQKEKGTSGKVFIGMPKELGSISEDKIIFKIPAEDELVKGFGKGLWVIKN